MNLERLLDDLVKQGKLKEQRTRPDYLEGLLNAANDNFVAAQKIFGSGFYVVAFM